MSDSVEIKEMNTEMFEQMMREHRELNPERLIRHDIQQALYRYAFSGMPPGDFLRSVVENDLFGALGRADSYNRATIHQICIYIYNELPSTCWGSPDKVQSHLNAFRELEGE